MFNIPMPRGAAFRAGVAAIVVFLTLDAARADFAADAAWANDFLGPGVTLGNGKKTPGAVHYWTDTVGVAFTRDVTIEIPPTPLDLNLDDKPDTTFSGKWELKGGILGNPALVGLIPTPDDPKGAVGVYSVSTGFLGVREELDPAARKGTGRYGFNCLLCHGGADAQGGILPGRPNTRIQLGLIMATARALQPDWIIRDNAALDPAGGEAAIASAPPITPAALLRHEGLDGVVDFDANHDGQVSIAEWRAALHMPAALEAQAVLILAGPGRLDQSIDYRMDGMIPLAQLNEHERATYGPQHTAQKARASKRAVFNPVSIPPFVIGIEVAHYSWSGKDSTFREDPLGLLTRAWKLAPAELADRIQFPHGDEVNSERLERALTLDFRNVSTSGRETDVALGIGWPHKVLTVPAVEDLATAEEFGAARLRRLLCAPLDGAAVRITTNTAANAAPPTATAGVGDAAAAAKGSADANEALVARGRELFLSKPCGRIINQRALIGREAHVPEKYKGIVELAPLDRSQPLDALVTVTCATCHNYSPCGPPRAMNAAADDLQRCDLCHLDHPLKGETDRFIPVAAYMQREGLKSAAECARCHEEHPEFGRQLYSNSWLLPFDADGDGKTAGDERGDGSAGGIGTDASLNIDSLFASQLQPAAGARRKQANYLLGTDARREPKEAKLSTEGFGWVRVAPLVTLRATAPYLHNGSVPTLAALLERGAQRPAKFAVGSAEQHFEYDTTLAGNGNMGHDYGVDFTAAEKQALIAFMEAIP